MPQLLRFRSFIDVEVLGLQLCSQAVFDFHGTSLMGGLAAMYAWRSVYWSEQVSMRTRALLMIDWISRCVSHSSVLFKRLIRRVDGLDVMMMVTVNRGIWGRDLSKL